MNKIEKIFEFFQYLYNFGIDVYKEKEKIANLRNETTKSLKSIEEEIDSILSMVERINKILKELDVNLNFLYKTLPKYLSVYEKETRDLENVLGYLEKSTDYIQELLSEIHSIEIISRNSEIKAFHLGEKGRGLSVVSQEISRLTERISGNASKISEILEDMKFKYSIIKNKLDNIYGYLSKIKKLEEDLNKILEEFGFATKEFSRISEVLRGIFSDRRRIVGKVFRNILDIESYAFSYFSESEKVLLYSDVFQGNDEIFNEIKNIYDEIKDEKNIFVKNRVGTKLKFYSDNLKILLNDFKGKIELIKNLGKTWKEKVNVVLDDIRRFYSQEKEITDVTSKIVNNLKIKFDTYITQIKEINDVVYNFYKEISSEELFSLEYLDSDFLKYLRILKDNLKDGEILSLYSSVETARAGILDDPLSNQLKEKVRNSLEITDEVLKIADNMNKAVKGKKKIEIDPREEKVYSNLEIYVRELENNFYYVSQSIEEFNKKISSFKENFSEIENFINKVNAEILKIEKQIENTKSLLNEVSKEYEVKKVIISEETPFVEELEIRTVLSSSPVTLDPYMAQDSISMRILENIHRSLFMVSPKSAKVVPALVEKFEIEKDGTLYIFHLRRGVRFHNGEYMNAFDVRDSLYRALNGKYKSYFEMIKGAKSYIKKITGNVEGIRVFDDYRIEIELEYPFSPFIHNLALLGASITKVVDGSLIGIGPFILKKYEKDKLIELEVFEDYFAGRSCVDKITFVIKPTNQDLLEEFRKCEYDFISPGAEDVDIINEKYKELSKNLYSAPIINIEKFNFNIEKFPFDNIHVRKAINYAINKDELIRKVLKNKPIKAKGVFPPSLDVYNENLIGYEFNLEKAKEEIIKADIELPMDITVTIPKRKTSREIAEFIKENLEKIGINLKIEEKEWQEFLNCVNSGDNQCNLIGWIADTGDPDSLIYSIFHSSSIGTLGNEARYRNPVVDKLIEEARKIRLPDERKKYYQEIEKKVLEDAPCVFLYHPVRFLLIKDNVKGIWPHPLGYPRLEIITKLVK